MIPQNILDEMYNCLDYADLKGFENQVKKYLKTTDESTKRDLEQRTIIQLFEKCK